MHPKKLFFVSVCCILLSLSVASAAGPSVKLIGEKHGPAQIEGAESPYYYFKARLEAKEPSIVAFKHDTCVLDGDGGNQVSNCWIQIVGGSAGLSEEKTAPLDMKTLTEAGNSQAGSDSVTLNHNTSKVDGPEASIVYSIPKGGFVELCFFWPVHKEFQPKRVILKGIATLDLAQPKLKK